MEADKNGQSGSAGAVHDLIVVGAGSGGCATALFAARYGCRVLLIDKRKREHIGEKISYDSIPPSVFEALGLPSPEAPELDAKGELLRVFSPSRKIAVDVPVPNLLVHRRLLCQRLLDYALEAGVELEDETSAVAPLIENGAVVGVAVAKEQHLVERRARIVVDASGFAAVIRRQLPPEIYLQEALAAEDTINAYREVRDIVGEDENCPPPDFPGYYDYLGYYGGYLWIVREEGTKANIGIGVQALPEHPEPSLPVRQFAEANKAVSSRIHLQGSGDPPRIAVRSCQPQLTTNGFLVVGEAACQVRPSTAYGVHPSLYAGRLAGEVCARALSAGDGGIERLWEYDVLWKKSFGATYAFFDAFRILIQSLTNDEIEALMAAGLLGREEFAALWNDYTFPTTVGYFVKKLLGGGWRFPRLSYKAYIAASTATALERHYRSFPDSPAGFGDWYARTKRLYASLYRRLGRPSPASGAAVSGGD